MGSIESLVPSAKMPNSTWPDRPVGNPARCQKTFQLARLRKKPWPLLLWQVSPADSETQVNSLPPFQVVPYGNVFAIDGSANGPASPEHGSGTPGAVRRSVTLFPVYSLSVPQPPAGMGSVGVRPLRRPQRM